MKKLLLFTILAFSFIITNAQRVRGYNNNYSYNNYSRPIIGQYPYHNVIIGSQPNRVQSSILPSLVGAMVGAAIVNGINNRQYNNSTQINRDQHYENQLELERLEIIKKELEIKEMKKRYRKEHGFRLFGNRHYHN